MFETRATISHLGMDKVAEERKGKIQGIHMLVCSLFSTGPQWSRAKDPFLYAREVREQALDVLFIRSQSKPKANPFFELGPIRKVTTGFEKGERFLFQCDFNPTKTKQGSLVDIVTDEQQNSKQPRTREELVFEWWQKREEHKGFRVHALRTAFHRKYDMPRDGRCMSVMRVVGDIEVADPKKFQSFFETGIGKEKAKGCGMLLLGSHQ